MLNRILLIAFLFSRFMSAHSQAFNYSEVLAKSLYFYECQRSGKLPSNSRVPWRGDSGLEDGKDNQVDLTGGWYDAGDHVKFGFPMASTATKLAWSALESESSYKSIDQWKIVLDNLRWVNDYFIKCHLKKQDGSTDKFFGQVGIGKTDHAWWGPAEKMTMDRPSFFVDAKHPGTELTAETAAAMAAASLVFKSEDPNYSKKLLAEAIELFKFSETYKGKYSNSIKDAKNHYESFSGYTDELALASIWLYKATKKIPYLEKAQYYYNQLPNEPNENVKSYSGGDSWDNKAYSCYVLFAITTGEMKYKEDAQRNLDYWSKGYNGKRIKYSSGGEAFLSKWGSLRFSANASFLALVYAKHLKGKEKQIGKTYTEFATGQINYMLGKNPLNQSYVVGFGNKSPVNPHHRSAHGSETFNYKDPVNNRFILYGALVGGPSKPDDTYTDARINFTENEVACDYNAGFTGALALLIGIFGAQTFEPF